jgi:hypothetical protein
MDVDVSRGTTRKATLCLGVSIHGGDCAEFLMAMTIESLERVRMYIEAENH